MSKKGMVKVVLVAEVKDKAKVKERLPGMIDNARKFPGVAHFDFSEVVKSFYSTFVILDVSKI